MAVVSVSSFRTSPGRLPEHLALSAESVTHLRRLGLQAITLQPVAGADVGTIATVINYASNAAYAAGMKLVRGDSGWQEFYARASGTGAAAQVEGSVLVDLDPAYQPPADRPVGVILFTQWRARPGRLVDFLGNVMTSLPHITRMGGFPRVTQSLLGPHPMTVIVTTGFADLDAYGAYSDAIGADEEWQAFWAGAMADPTADLVRTNLYLNTSG